MKSKFSKILGVALPVAMIVTMAVALFPARTPTVEAAEGILRYTTVSIPEIGSDGRYVLAPNVDIGAIDISASGTIMYAADVSSLSQANTDSSDTNNVVTSTNTTIGMATTAGFRTSGVVAIEEELIFYETITATALLGATRGFADTTAAAHATGIQVNEVTMVYKSTDSGYTWKEVEGFNAVTGADNQTPIVDIGLSPEYDSDTTLFVATEDFVYQSVDGGSTFSAMDQPTGWDVTNENITDMDITLDSVGRQALVIGSTDTAGLDGEVYVFSPATTGMSWKAQGIGGTSNVLAAAFSPNFASDEGIFAVTVNTTGSITTEIRASFGFTKNGGGWGDSIGDGEFLDRLAASISTTSRASIAFPDDFDVDSLSSNVAFVGLTAGPSDGRNNNGTELGDVYKVIFQPTKSTTIDLDVRGLIATIQTTTNIYSIDVSGDAAAATILVGTDFWSRSVTPYYWLSYYSTDSGATWSSARESSPTGGSLNLANDLLSNGAGANVVIMLSPDFADDGVAYAATSGATSSGLSRTSNGGKSWNQISLIDWGETAYTVGEMDSKGSTWYFRFEYSDGSKSSLWVTTDGGANYERLYSYANPDMSDDYDALDIKGDVFFLTKYSLGRFWRSTDRGVTFPRTIRSKETTMVTRSIAGESTIYTLHAGGKLWYTENLGRPWIEPEETILSGTLTGISREGDIHLVKNSAGRIYVSLDASKTYLSTLGTTDKSGKANIKFDPNFDDNKFIYNGIDGGSDRGIWRIEFNEDNPESTDWKRIDDLNDPVTAGLITIDSLSISSGVMYAYDDKAVSDNTGGMWRSTNFSDDIDGLYPPRFTQSTRGLTAGQKADGLKQLTVKGVGRAMYFIDKSRAGTTNYQNQLLVFTDTLNKGAAQVAPEDGATDAGVSLNTEDLTMTAVLTWEAKAGATSYQWQLARDSGFLSVVDSGYTTANEVRSKERIAGDKYYWRVRVAADGPVGAPLISPWSDTRSFTVGSAFEVQFKVTSPEIGATGVELQPTFTWTKVPGAVSYEMVVSEDTSFAILDAAFTTDSPFAKAPEALAYDSTYYWRVRAITGPAVKVGSGRSAKMVTPVGPWENGVFTTMAEPVAPTPPVIIEPTAPAPAPEVKVIEVPIPAPAPAIPTGLLVAIVGIGAVLVIALIVLIVRTRRVA